MPWYKMRVLIGIACLLSCIVAGTVVIAQTPTSPPDPPGKMSFQRGGGANPPPNLDKCRPG